MNTDKNRELLWRTVPFVMAMLLLALTGIPASAIFGREKAAPAADAGAPIAQSIDVRVYRGIPYTGTLAAIDREGGDVVFGGCCGSGLFNADEAAANVLPTCVAPGAIACPPRSGPVAAAPGAGDVSAPGLRVRLWAFRRDGAVRADGTDEQSEKDGGCPNVHSLFLL